MTPAPADDLPADVRKLIDQSIRSVGHLESLIFLFQNRTRNWSASELSREMRTNEAYADQQLRELSPLVATKDGKFEYVGSSDTDHTVQGLIDLYRGRRYAIINYIYAKSTDALRSFADAFKLKRD